MRRILPLRPKMNQENPDPERARQVCCCEACKAKRGPVLKLSPLDMVFLSELRITSKGGDAQ